MTRPRLPNNPGLGLAGTVLIHGLSAAVLFAGGTARRPVPPTYQVHLVAAPEPVEGARKAPDVVQRPAEDRPAPVAKPKPEPRSVASKAPPPPTADAKRREAAPRSTSQTAPLPGERPSTGNDVASISTEGIEFPYPEYLQNIMTQVLRRWQRPVDGLALDAEVSFFVHRDGSISDLQFVKRSGSFAYDLEAEGAAEEAGRIKAFGPLPAGWQSDVLFVRFYFSPRPQ